MRFGAGKIAGLCNGSTPDSDSVCEGSNPSPAANRRTLKLLRFQGFFLSYAVRSGSLPKVEVTRKHKTYPSSFTKSRLGIVFLGPLLSHRRKYRRCRDRIRALKALAFKDFRVVQYAFFKRITYYTGVPMH